MLRPTLMLCFGKTKKYRKPGKKLYGRSKFEKKQIGANIEISFAELYWLVKKGS